MFLLSRLLYVCVPTPPPSNFWQYMRKQRGKAWAISSKEWCQCLLWWTEERRAPDQLHSTAYSLSWTVNSKCLTSRTFRTTFAWTHSTRKLRLGIIQTPSLLCEHWLNLFMQQDLTDHPSPLVHTASNQNLEPGELRLRERGYLIVPRTLIPVSVACHGSKSTDSKCTDIKMIMSQWCVVVSQWCHNDV